MLSTIFIKRNYVFRLRHKDLLTQVVSLASSKRIPFDSTKRENVGIISNKFRNFLLY